MIVSHPPFNGIPIFMTRSFICNMLNHICRTRPRTAQHELQSVAATKLKFALHPDRINFYCQVVVDELFQSDQRR